MSKISLYILREHTGPLLLALFTITFILLMNRIFRMIDLIISKGLEPATVFKLFLLTLPFLLAMTIPMAVLVAVVLAFGRMAGDNEIMAFKASGINLFRLIAPVFLASTLLTGGMIYFNDAILPETNHAFKKLMIAIHRKHPTLSIEEKLFIDDFDGYQIYITEKDDEASTIYGVIIHEIGQNLRIDRSIFAKSGHIGYNAANSSFIITLYDGEIHQIDPDDPTKYRRMAFKTQKMNLYVDTSIQEDVHTGRGDRELSIDAMREKIAHYRDEKYKIEQKLATLKIEQEKIEADTLSAAEKAFANFDSTAGDSARKKPQWNPDQSLSPAGIQAQIDQQQSRLKRSIQSINRYEVEIQKKYALPFACMVFVLIGAPLGVVGRRGVGIIFSFAAFTFYYICLIGGEELADRNIISPYVAMWTANVILGAVGMFLIFYSNHERVVIKWTWFLKVIPAPLRRKIISILSANTPDTSS